MVSPIGSPKHVLNDTESTSSDPGKDNRADQARTAILVLCGLPASGKTSVAQSLLQHSSHIPLRCLHVCFDSIITANSQGQAIQQTSAEASSPAPASSPANSTDLLTNDNWQASRASALALIRSSLHSAAAGSSLGQHTLVIADDNMQFRSMRHECYQLAAAEGAAYLQLYMPCTAEDAVKRNAARTSEHMQVSEASIMKMATAIQPPQPTRFLWEEPTLCLSPQPKHHAESEAADIPLPQNSQTSESSISPTAVAHPSGYHVVTTTTTSVSSDSTLMSAIWAHWGSAVPVSDSAEARLIHGEVTRAGQEVARAATAASQLHTLDKDSRALVASTMAAAAPSQRKQLAVLLHAERKALMERARAGPPASVCEDKFQEPGDRGIAHQRAKSSCVKPSQPAHACLDDFEPPSLAGVAQRRTAPLERVMTRQALHVLVDGGEGTGDEHEAVASAAAVDVESTLFPPSVSVTLNSASGSTSVANELQLYGVGVSSLANLVSTCQTTLLVTEAAGSGASRATEGRLNTGVAVDNRGEAFSSTITSTCVVQKSVGFCEQQLALFQEVCRNCLLTL